MEGLNIENQILAKMKQTKAGKLFFPDMFSDLAENAAIRKALQRLTGKGSITRVAQGIYVIPQNSSLVGQIMPGAEAVAAAIAKRDKIRIVPTGYQAQYLLGLSTQIPTKVVYLTDGVQRIIHVGKQTINFKKTAPKTLAAKGEISSLVIQALKTIGKEYVTETEKNIVLNHLKNEKQELIKHDLKLAPQWIGDIMKEALKQE